MSNLSEYIEKVKEYKKKNQNISEEELIRYVYLDLGKRFSFDLSFSFGNTKTKKRIYAHSKKEEDLDKAYRYFVNMYSDTYKVKTVNNV